MDRDEIPGDLQDENDGLGLYPPIGVGPFIGTARFRVVRKKSERREWSPQYAVLGEIGQTHRYILMNLDDGKLYIQDPTGYESVPDDEIR